MGTPVRDSELTPGTAIGDIPADAFAVVATFVRRYWLTAGAFRASVQSVENVGESYARAHHVVERRVVEMRTEPAHGTTRGALSRLPIIGDLDPWNVDIEALESASRVLSTCPTCDGAKLAACADCTGSLSVSCPECRGSRFVPGQRGMKQCPKCRARGSVRCHACKRGIQPCTTCAQDGRVFAWLTVGRFRSEGVCIDHDCAAVRVHGAARIPADFDADPASWPHSLVADSGVCVATPNLPLNLAPMLAGTNDRVVSTRTQAFTAIVLRLRYRLGPFEGFLDVGGRPAAIGATSDARALVRRRVAIIVAGLSLSFVALFVIIAYVARDAWYRAYGHAGWLAFALLVGAMSAPVAMGGGLLARSARSMWRTWLPLGVCVLALVQSIVIWTAWRPSVRAAVSALAIGDLERAQVEANALIDLGIDARSGGDVLDDIRIARLSEAREIDDLIYRLKQPWHSVVRENNAKAIVRSRVEREARTLFDRHDETRLVWLAATVAGFDELLHSSVDALASLLLTQARASRGDIDGALSAFGRSQAAPANDIEATRALLATAAERLLARSVSDASSASEVRAKRDALTRALHLSRQLNSIGLSPSPPTADLEVQILAIKPQADLLDARDAERARADEARRRRDAESQRRLDEQRRKLEEAREHEANRSIICSDGWVSGCLCHGNHRGCCSHHGGMAGCEP